MCVIQILKLTVDRNELRDSYDSVSEQYEQLKVSMAFPLCLHFNHRHLWPKVILKNIGLVLPRHVIFILSMQ